ncbi:helix-turn-helix transcriptional regulator [Legionella clemsonensis]|uniref:Bacterial regulatory proteins, luxR family n=1 Tax=Legionella clemsonensis TaxID=1867846 RepID=A0A222P4T3_9GAMM|nr:LuxR C-terminal-related transcriptional regulator [Legionella clemsonensis]ASQ46858.1 Bacterial regulatory proteins, luxR family [Legionella clemsonensis]
MTRVISKGHISISCSQDMLKIAAPLLDRGLSYFEHVRLYDCGKIAWLSTDDNRARSILEKEISGALNFDFSKLQYERHLFAEDIVSTIKNPEMYKIAFNKLVDSRDNFDIRNLFQIVSVKNGIYEAFVFGTNEKNNLQKSTYINLIPYLEHFIFYYYEKAEKLIIRAEKEAITIQGLRINNCDPPNLNPVMLRSNKYYFDLVKRDDYLTDREYQVCCFLIQGYSRKEIATFLNLKSRTIDSLILNAVERNGTYSLTQLLNKIKNSDIRFCLNTSYFNVPSNNLK